MMHQAKLGLWENRQQFALLVLVNAFVGGMIGMERSILPQIAEEAFGLAAKSAILSFIVVFGVVKAITNFYMGALAHKWGRRNLLIAGWLFALPVPFILMYAPSWSWVVGANVFMGIHQGLAWSSTVVMKIDLVGPKNRGLAMGLNEFAGYLSVAAVAWLTGWLASHYGLRPVPFYTGVVLLVLGLATSILWVRDTKHHIAAETPQSDLPRLQHIFWDTTWKHKNLGAVTQAGLVNNLNDGMAWGLLPILLASKGFGLAEIGLVAAIYPSVWGAGQLITGALADTFCKKKMIFWGMALQGVALLFLVPAHSLWHFVAIAILLGWGTAMVYPTFLAAVAENTHPQDRAQSLGIFRFWRDLGYAIGALLTGLLLDLAGINTIIIVVALLTLVSAWIIQVRMGCRAVV